LPSLDWVLPGRLAVGPFPRLTQPLVDEGVSAVLSLTEEREGPLPADLAERCRWDRVPLTDFDAIGERPLTSDDFERCVAILRAWAVEGETIYVHCMAGHGRSPVVCMAYCCVVAGQPLCEAIWRVRQARPYACPSARSLAALCRYVLSTPHAAVL